LPATSLFKLTNEAWEPNRGLPESGKHLLKIEASIAEGQLQLSWIYNPNVYRQSTIERLAHDFMDALEILIAHCQSPEAGGYTPSDFPEADLSQQELDALMAEISQL
jgi:non-ribosomal peptide synthase protein (TIGR01720 family)